LYIFYNNLCRLYIDYIEMHYIHFRIPTERFKKFISQKNKDFTLKEWKKKKKSIPINYFSIYFCFIIFYYKNFIFFNEKFIKYLFYIYFIEFYNYNQSLMKILFYIYFIFILYLFYRILQLPPKFNYNINVINIFLII